MSEKRLTFFEVHLHDRVQFGPRTLATGEASLGEGEEAENEPEPATTEATDETGGAAGLLGPLLALGLLAAAVYAGRKLLADGPAGLDALDDVDEFPGGEGDDDAVPIEITTPEEEGGVGLLLLAALGLLVLGVLALRKLLSGSGETVVGEE